MRQLLTHAEPSPGGDAFRYDPDRFAQLGRVVETCVPQPYRKTIAVRLLEFLAMKDSVPGRDVQDEAVVTQNLFATSVQQRYKDVLERVALPYKVDKKGRSSRNTAGRETLSASAGVVSTVRDLARFDAALDARCWCARTRWRRPGPTRSAATAPAHRPRMVRPESQRRDDRLAVRHDDECLLVADAEDPGETPDADPAGQQRRPELTFDLASGDVTKSLFAVLFLSPFG